MANHDQDQAVSGCQCSQCAAKRQAAENASLRADLKQALRQWAMYAEMVERNEGFEFEKEKSPEADMYRAIKARISEQKRRDE